MNRLNRQVCPACGYDDLSVEPIAPGHWRLECAPHPSHPEGGAYAWETSDATDDELRERAGITAELGLYDDLPRCLAKDEPWIEYGIIEHRYKEMKPKVYAELVDRYGHTALGPKRYTASAFIAAALGHLRDDGELVRTSLPATGYWKFNGNISYWALAPGPASDASVTWADFATSQGMDPEAWVIGGNA